MKKRILVFIFSIAGAIIATDSAFAQIGIGNKGGDICSAIKGCPGVQGPKGATGPAGPAGPDGNIYFVMGPIKSTECAEYTASFSSGVVQQRWYCKDNLFAQRVLCHDPLDEASYPFFDKMIVISDGPLKNQNFVPYTFGRSSDLPPNTSGSEGPLTVTFTKNDQNIPVSARDVKACIRSASFLNRLSIP